MIDPTPLESETPIFTEREAYVLAYAVAHFLVDAAVLEYEFVRVTAFIQHAIPEILSR